MATLQVCYKDANGQLKCYPSSSPTMMTAQTDSTGTKKDFSQIVNEIRDLLKQEGVDGTQPDVVSILYFAD